MESVRAFNQRTFSSLSVRNYRLYVIGQGISLSGTWMQSVAQGLLVLALTGSGTALGLVTALQALPVLFFGPWGGVIADRFPKRKILYATQSCAGRHRRGVHPIGRGPPRPPRSMSARADHPWALSAPSNPPRARRMPTSS